MIVALYTIVVIVAQEMKVVVVVRVVSVAMLVKNVLTKINKFKTHRNYEPIYTVREVQEKLLNDFFIPTDKVGVFIDEHQRPYIQTPRGKEYCSARTSYNYSIKN